jgi:hypothetical protein
MFAPSFLWLIIGDREPEDIFRPLCSFIHPDVEIVFAEVENIEV